MTRHYGGEKVGVGYYWSFRNGGVIDVKEEGVLPGDGRSGYYRLPFGILFCLVIALGGFYIVLLPLLIAGAALQFGSVRIFGGLVHQFRKSVSFGWRPTEAYLAGKNGKEKKVEEKKD